MLCSTGPQSAMPEAERQLNCLEKVTGGVKMTARNAQSCRTNRFRCLVRGLVEAASEAYLILWKPALWNIKAPDRLV